MTCEYTIKVKNEDHQNYLEKTSHQHSEVFSNRQLQQISFSCKFFCMILKLSRAGPRVLVGSGGSRISQNWGCQSLRRSVNIAKISAFSCNFPGKLHENEEMLTQRSSDRGNNHKHLVRGQSVHVKFHSLI